MPTLATELRNKLERAVIAARDASEAGARAALQTLAVHHHEPYPHMKPAQCELRNQLRARARQLGDRKLPKPDASGKDHEIEHLAIECAYEHWHRMLFARFLAENGLLIEPQENEAINLVEAEELAKEDGVDVWVFASRCAQRMLPQIFRPEDPLLQVSFAAEHMLKLEKLLASLPQAVFTASDALGWVYQFWQSKKKDEVNRSEVKIGADQIAAVTQLFTEPYMVEFLLHNTLGAWWAGKKLAAKEAAGAKKEEELRSKLALPGVGWEYLRFVRGEDGKAGPWRPAAGTFDGWPKIAVELKVLDPCCGSGHFLVAALHHLVPIRMAEEGLSARGAIDAVLRDNLHGLEIDERCCQIAAFALAFAAWTYPDAGGYRQLPTLHIACTGIGPQSTAEEWVKLTEQSGIPMPSVGRQAIRNGLMNLHRLFSQAPTLGSLINPAELPADLLAAGYEAIQPYLAAIMSAEKTDDETRERAIAAAGMVRAADILTGEYTLVITNVPFLAKNNQSTVLRSHIEAHYVEGSGNLSMAMVERCRSLSRGETTYAVVTIQDWLFLKLYQLLRKDLLTRQSFNCIVKMGAKAFSTQMWDFNTMLLVASNCRPSDQHRIAAIDIMEPQNAVGKAREIDRRDVEFVQQTEQLKNPSSTIVVEATSGEKLLAEDADSFTGVQTGDDRRYRMLFWEVVCPDEDWRYDQRTVGTALLYGGRQGVLRWEGDGNVLRQTPGAYIRGEAAWGKRGVAVSQMQTLPATLYDGDCWNMNCAVIIPKHAKDLPALWTFCCSDDFARKVRSINQALKVNPGYFLKVPADIRRWETVAAKKYPDGLPEPESDDPAQWLFHGRPEESTAPLHVGVTRLLRYRWPAELDDKMRLSKRARALVKRCDELGKFADDDGIVCIPSVRGEEPAADRLEALLAAAGIEPAKVRELAGGADLDDWLRNSFFEEHCKLFHDRPFIWHIWDGRKRDGFHALVNYHKLCEGGGKGRKLLESLAYSYLGDWIIRQKDGLKRGDGGADDRLAAALELQNRLRLIVDGEPPFDIFVRWKPLAEQPVGWEPDINDGVRMNIRPFLASDLPGGRTGAGVLRYKPNIKRDKDGGKEPERPKSEYPWFWGWDETTEDFMGGKKFDGNRHNDCHYSINAKQIARAVAKKGNR